MGQDHIPKCALGRTGISLQNAKKGKRIQVLKLMHNWDNFGGGKHQINLTSSMCLVCDIQVEDKSHYLRCNNQIQDKSGNELHKSLIQEGTLPLLIGIMMQTLVRDESPLPDPQTTRLCTQVNNTIISQTQLGWDNMAKGYLSKEWEVTHQSICKYNTKQSKDGWETHIIKEIWMYNLRLWSHRNTTLHLASPGQTKSKEIVIQHSNSILEEHQYNLHPNDRKLITIHSKCFKTMSKHRIKKWIEMVVHSADTMKQSVSRQTSIQKYFSTQVQENNQ